MINRNTKETHSHTRLGTQNKKKTLTHAKGDKLM